MKLKKNNIFYLSITIIIVSVLMDKVPSFFIEERAKLSSVKEEYKIAVIDSGFEISDFDSERISMPFNAYESSNKIDEIPEWKGRTTHKSGHGNSMLKIFIGENGYLLNGKIIPIQVYSYKELPKALNHAIKNGAQAISISLSFNDLNKSIQGVAQESLLNASKKALIFIAAGNDGLNLNSFYYGKSMIKLAQKSNGRIFLIGASYLSIKGEEKADFSNFIFPGEFNSFYFEAPGQNILLGSLKEKLRKQGINGTSIATPIALMATISLAEQKQISLYKAAKEKVKNFNKKGT